MNKSAKFALATLAQLLIDLLSLLHLSLFVVVVVGKHSLMHELKSELK